MCLLMFLLEPILVSDIIGKDLIKKNRGRSSMAKVYQFPSNKQVKNHKIPQYSSEHSMLQSMMESLVLTYEEKIKELEAYKEEIKALDGLSLKTPREVLKQVKVLQKLLLKYGMSCNFFKFFTKGDVQILYYNESNTIYVVKNENLKEARDLTAGEFIQEFEGYPFSLSIEAAVLEIFENQINNLQITITTLKNTQI